MLHMPMPPSQSTSSSSSLPPACGCVWVCACVLGKVGGEHTRCTKFVHKHNRSTLVSMQRYHTHTAAMPVNIVIVTVTCCMCVRVLGGGVVCEEEASEEEVRLWGATKVTASCSRVCFEITANKNHAGHTSNSCSPSIRMFLHLCSTQVWGRRHERQASTRRDKRFEASQQLVTVPH